MRERVEKTSERFNGSEEALVQSNHTMTELAGSFERLNERFVVLYDNIESQNYNIHQIDSVFEDLNQKAADMYNSSLANQTAVDSIAQAMNAFSENIGEIVKNTQSI